MLIYAPLHGQQLLEGGRPFGEERAELEEDVVALLGALAPAMDANTPFHAHNRLHDVPPSLYDHNHLGCGQHGIGLAYIRPRRNSASQPACVLRT